MVNPYWFLGPWAGPLRTFEGCAVSESKVEPKFTCLSLGRRPPPWPNPPPPRRAPAGPRCLWACEAGPALKVPLFPPAAAAPLRPRKGFASVTLLGALPPPGLRDNFLGLGTVSTLGVPLPPPAPAFLTPPAAGFKPGGRLPPFCGCCFWLLPPFF